MEQPELEDLPQHGPRPGLKDPLRVQPGAPQLGGGRRRLPLDEVHVVSTRRVVHGSCTRGMTTVSSSAK
nr:hypothetical protein [Streptomyces mirabilis]